MKRLLIIAEDIVKIQTFTGFLGKVFTSFYLAWFKFNLILKIWWLEKFYQVSILTSDCFNLKHARVYYYSQELSKMNYADNRLDYWHKTTQLLKQIKSASPEFFQESGIDITEVFKTRLCANLTYEYLVYDQLNKKIIQIILPDKVVYFRSLYWFKNWLFSWLLKREYQLKLAKFILLSQQQNKITQAENMVFLSVDFFRHRKTLKPIFQALKQTNYQPIYITDANLAPFLPESSIMAKQYLNQVGKILKRFRHPLQPMILYNLVLSRLYLQAAENLFLKLKPKRLIVVSDLRLLENSLSLVAKKNQVRSIMVSPNMILDLAEINAYDTTDKVALPGEFIRQKLIKQGINPKKLSVVGDLQTFNKPKFTKQQVYNQLGVKDLNKKLVLLISFRPNWLIPLSEKQKFFTWSVNAVEKIPNAILVVKPHPTERRHRIIGELRGMKLNNLIVTNNEQLELVDLLAAASVVLQTWSMSLFEAVNLNRPVISVNPFNKNYDFFLPVIKAGGAVEVTSQKELLNHLKAFLYDKEIVKRQLMVARKAISKFIVPSDGQAVQRVLSLLE